MGRFDAERSAQWAKNESRKLADDWPMGSPLETDILETWRRNRPKMFKELEAHGAAREMAHVLADRFMRSEKKYLEAGMPQTDAREQAEREWLMREPEDDEDDSGLADPQDREASAPEEEFSRWRISSDDDTVLFRLSEKLRELAPLARRGTDFVALGEALEALEHISNGDPVDVDVVISVGFRWGNEQLEEGLFMDIRINNEEIILDELITTYSSAVGSDHVTNVYASLKPSGGFDAVGVEDWLEKLDEVKGFQDACLDTERDHV